MELTGVLVVERLEQIKRSLIRMQEAIEREQEHRNEYDSYKDVYVSDLLHLQTELSKLEQSLPRILAYA